MSSIRRKTVVGRVVSDKMDSTITVAYETIVKHNKYGKYIKRTKKYYAHDPENTAKSGDIVKIVESRPLSKLKRWTLLEIVKRSGEKITVSEEDLTPEILRESRKEKELEIQEEEMQETQNEKEKDETEDTGEQE